LITRCKGAQRTTDKAPKSKSDISSQTSAVQNRRLCGDLELAYLVALIRARLSGWLILSNWNDELSRAGE
jgi:hypothetical protein